MPLTRHFGTSCRIAGRAMAWQSPVPRAPIRALSTVASKRAATTVAHSERNMCFGAKAATTGASAASPAVAGLLLPGLQVTAAAGSQESKSPVAQAAANVDSLATPTKGASGPGPQSHPEPGKTGWVANRGCVWEDRRYPSGRGFLEAMPHGAYTTTRTIHRGTRVLMWEFHLARILDSLRRLHAAHPELFPHSTLTQPLSELTQPHSHLTQPHSTLSGPLHPDLLLQKEVATCCQLAWSAVQGSATWQALAVAETEESDAVSAVQGSHQCPEILFTVLICGNQPEQQQQPANPQGKDQEELGFETRSNGAGQSERRRFEVYVHASVFLAPAWTTDTLDGEVSPPMAMGHVAPSQGCSVAVMGPPRTVPLAKFSEWPTRRKVLERCKPKGAREVLLSPDGDLLLEGLITNFFVARRRQGVKIQDSRNSNSAPGLSLDEVEVVTAPLEGFGVLPGSIREVLLGIFESRGIPVILEAPRLEGRDSWTAAFVTNALWIIEPVRCILSPAAWPEGGGTMEDTWSDCSGAAWREYHLPEDKESGTFIRIQSWLRHELEATSHAFPLFDGTNGPT